MILSTEISMIIDAHYTEYFDAQCHKMYCNSNKLDYVSNMDYVIKLDVSGNIFLGSSNKANIIYWYYMSLSRLFVAKCRQ